MNGINRFFLTVLICASVVMAAHGWPKQGEIGAPPGAQFGWDGSYWRPLAVGSDGSTSSAGGSATAPMVLPFTTYNAAIPANTAVSIGSIASFSAGNYVTLRTNAKVYWAGQGSTSTASAVLGDYIDSGEQIGFTVASSTAGTWGVSYFYSTSAASVSMRVWPTSR